jgi:hypothetical protein
MIKGIFDGQRVMAIDLVPIYYIVYIGKCVTNGGVKIFV